MKNTSVLPPIKVLNIVVTLGLGGIEKFLLRTISHIDHGRWQMDVLCQRSLSGSLLEEYRKQPVQLIECFYSYTNPLTWWRLFRFFKTHRYDIVCDFTGDLAGIPLLLARMAGISTRIAWYRSAGVSYKPGIRSIYAAVSRWIVKCNATKILSNSAANLHAFYGLRHQEDSRFHVVPNGLNIDDFNPKCPNRQRVRNELDIDDSRKVIGHVGSFSPEKNHEAILEVAKIVSKQRSDILFLLIGDGQLRGAIEEKAKTHNISDLILTLGNRSDVPDLLQAMDVFFFPSHHEGLPNALIEAMLSGIPIVASDIPPHREAVPPIYYDKLFPPENLKVAAAMLLDVVENPNFNIAQSAVEWGRSRYGIDRVLRQYTQLLASE